MVPCSQLFVPLEETGEWRMDKVVIYATNNCGVGEELFLSSLGTLKCFWEHPGSGRRNASSRVQAWAGPELRSISWAMPDPGLYRRASCRARPGSGKTASMSVQCCTK